MAKEWELTVHRPVPEKSGVTYPMRVVQIEKDRSPDRSVLATLQHLSGKYLGQIRRIYLPPTIRGSDHPTAQFFAACGMVVHVHAKLKPKQAIGSIIGVVFAANPATEEPEPAIFTPLKQEPHHDERPESQSAPVVR
jgi:hypothetical protein